MKDVKRDILDKITPEIRKEMESIWFTADLHAQHPKIVDICNRPVYLTPTQLIDVKQKDVSDPVYKNFINIAHDEWLIKEVINKYVKNKDTLFILGDVTMANKIASDKFLDRLNGNKRLISGNHDKNINHSTRFAEITQIKDFTFSRKESAINIHIVLCHYKMVSWNRKIHGSWMLHGHDHCRNNFNTGLSFDVGIDKIGIWRPYNLYEICQIMYQKSIGIEEDKILKSL